MEMALDHGLLNLPLSKREITDAQAAHKEHQAGDDYSAYIGREAIWRGQWVMIESADESGTDVTDQDGGNHSVCWGSLDVIGAAA